MKVFNPILALAFGAVVQCRVIKKPFKVVLTNDDGWAVAQIRSEYEALVAEGYEVILSAPAINKSGTGSSTAPPTNLTAPCEFDTCAAGAPAIGTDPKDRNIHYVNAFPADSVRVGIQEFARRRWGGPPHFVISGTNIGTNLGPVANISGTIGAAREATLEGVPSYAFSGTSGSQISYTTLSNSTAPSTITAHIYTKLVLKLIKTVTRPGPPELLPKGTTVTVNFASTANCTNADHFKWVFTRLLPSNSSSDIHVCGSKILPAEGDAIKQGCIATVSVFNATNKGDVGAESQRPVYNRLRPILSCL
jgi:5'/3'-nucleotidase SurE